MSKTLFVDTWGWLSLRDKRENKHLETAKLYHSYAQEKCTIVTTDYVLDETFTLFFKRLPFGLAQESMTLLLKSIDNGTIVLEWITPERFSQAIQLRNRFIDKPGISFTDLSSMAVMQEIGISDILTEDAHFEHVNLGFKSIPSRD